MPRREFGVPYVIGFSAAVCAVCAVFVAGAAVVLAERQEVNALLDKQRNVLEAAGLVLAGETVTKEEIQARFARVEAIPIVLETGEVAEGVDPVTFDQQAAKKDPARSRPAPPNASVIMRLPEVALVYRVLDDAGEVEKLVLPVEGYGLWSTLYGFLALEADARTVAGLTFYRHGETPGLGGEVDNQKWKSLWRGRFAFDDEWEPTIRVVKGQAPPADEAPYMVDGLSGATITSRGVTNLLQFWLGPNGFGPFLERYRAEHPQAVATENPRRAA